MSKTAPLISFIINDHLVNFIIAHSAQICNRLNKKDEILLAESAIFSAFFRLLYGMY